MLEKHKRHGLDVVRGGSYTAARLGDHTKRALSDAFFLCAGNPRARCGGAHASKRCGERRVAARAHAAWRRARDDDVFSETADGSLPGATVCWSRTPTTIGGPRAAFARESSRPKAPPKAPPERGRPTARRPPAPAPSGAPVGAPGESETAGNPGGGVGSAPRASRGVRGSGRGREARARAREDGAGRAGEDQGAAGAGVGSIRRAIVSIGSFSSKKNGITCIRGHLFVFTGGAESLAGTELTTREEGGWGGWHSVPSTAGGGRARGVGGRRGRGPRVLLTSARGERASGVDLSCRMGRLRDVTAGLSATFARLRGRTRDAPANAKQHHRRRRRRKVRALPPIRPSEASRLDREEASSGTEQTAFFFATNLVSFRTRRADAPRPLTDDTSHPDRIPTPSISHALTHTHAHSRTLTHTHSP